MVRDLHAEAVSKLLWPKRKESVSYVVKALEEAAERVPGDAQILNDLAAAYFVRAQQNDEPYGLVVALSTIDKAVAADGELLEARFNRALILQELCLRRDASQAWQDYLRRDDRSAWVEEARNRLEELRRLPDLELWPQQRQLLDEAALRGDRETVTRIVDRFRQPARQYAEEKLLAAWGERAAAGQAIEAARFLTIARAIGTALLEGGADAMVHDAVEVIDRARSDKLPCLVEGYEAYGIGLRLYQDREIDRALPYLGRAERSFRCAETPFVHWVRVYLASCNYFHESFERSFLSFDRLRNPLLGSRYPSLLGRIEFVMGSIDVLRGKPGDSLWHLQEALQLFERTGEVEDVAAMHQHLALALGSLGELDSSWIHLLKALRMLDGVHSFRRTFGILDEAEIASRQSGHMDVAVYFLNELFAVALRWKDPDQVVAVLMRRARTYHLTGHSQDALRELAAAHRRSEEIVDPEIRERTRAHILMAEGEVLLASDPKLAIEALNEAIRCYEVAEYHYYLAVAFFSRARAHLAIDAEEEAGNDYQAGLREIESARDNLRSGSLRIALYDQASALFDEILAFQVTRRGRHAAAFEISEEARARQLLDEVNLASFSRTLQPPSSRILTANEVQQILPKGTAIVKYAVLRDAVLVWIVTRRGVQLRRLPVNSRDLQARVVSVTEAMQCGEGSPILFRGLRGLYGILINPVKSDLQEILNLVFIPDKGLHLLPFAALIDPLTGRYLVEDYTVAISPSANVYARCLLRYNKLKAHRPETALVVGNPEFDRHHFSHLPFLRGAEREAGFVADLYDSGSRLLKGSEATKARFVQSIREGPDVIHFAGHAISNSDFPELSVLLLAAGHGTRHAGVLYSHEIYSLQFNRTQLVILSACDTAAGRLSVSEGSMSLVRPFLAAGVPAVLASLWKVDDSAGFELLTRFHLNLRSGSDPVSALRAAQMSLLEVERLGPPGRWASFQIIGGSSPIPRR